MIIRIKQSRSDRLEETRRALLNAAVEVVGEDGYAGASVAKIAARANVANGTFYNYFETRQALFDQLLPALGEQLLSYIKAHTEDSATGLERERQRLVAYFDFCRRTPGWLRVLNEAEVFAPDAFHRHVKRMYAGYIRSLKRSLQRDEIEGVSEDDLGAIAFMLMGMRSYMTMLYQYKYIDRNEASIERLIDIYCRLISARLFKPNGEIRSTLHAHPNTTTDDRPQLPSEGRLTDAKA